MKFKKSVLLVLSLMFAIVFTGLVSAAVAGIPLTGQGRNTVNMTYITPESKIKPVGGIGQGLSDGFNVTILNISTMQLVSSPTCLSSDTSFYTEIWINNTNGSTSYNISQIIFELPDIAVRNSSLSSIKLQYSVGNGSASGGEFKARNWSDCGTSENPHKTTCVNFTRVDDAHLNISIANGANPTKINITYSFADISDTFTTTTDGACSNKKTLDYTLISSGDYFNISDCNVKVDPPGSIDKVNFVHFDGGAVTFTQSAGIITVSSLRSFTNGTARTMKVSYDQGNGCDADDGGTSAAATAAALAIGRPQPPTLTGNGFVDGLNNIRFRFQVGIFNIRTRFADIRINVQQRLGR